MIDKLKDPLFYIPSFFRVLSKANASGMSDLVPMKLWRMQQHYITNRSHRDILLKGRQMGSTTGILAANSHKVFTEPFHRMAIITHDYETSEFLLQNVHRFHANLPKEIKPETDWMSGSRMRFPKLDAYIYIDSAKSDTMGIGHGLTIVHACLHPESLVLLTDGTMRPISEIAIGDVTTSKKWGTPVSVNGVYSRPYKGQLCKLYFYGNCSTPLVCTPEHRIMGSVNQEGWVEASKAKWIGSPIREIKPEIYELPKYKYMAGNERKYVPDGSVKLDYEFGWVLGLFYAEGSFTGRSLTFSISTKETDFAEKIKAFSEKYDWSTATNIIETHGVIDGRDVIGKTLNVLVHGAALCDVVRNIVGRDKYMPDWLWKCPPEFLNGIIDGYIAGDGHEPEGKCYRYYVTSVRPHLLYQLRELLLSTRKEYGAIIYSPAKKAWALQGPMHPCKNSEYRHDGGYRYVKFRRLYRQDFVFVKIKKREMVEYDGPVYDLETKGSFKVPCGIVHNSEMSRWPQKNADDLFAGISQTVPRGGYITVESTPRGRVGIFYELYEAARRGESEYKSFFYPWWWDENYTIPEVTKHERNAQLEACARILGLSAEKLMEQERQLMEREKLTPGQIAFRRSKIMELRELFFQEYPENDIDCWLSNEQAVIDGLSLRPYYNYIEAGRNEGNITFWRGPVGGHTYVVGVDTASGAARDYSVASVLDCRTMEYVARLRGKLHPDLFAEELYRLARIYNSAMIAVERIGHGHAVIKVLMEKDYPNQYYHTDYDEVTKEISASAGWKTSVKTKPLMVDGMVQAFRSQELRSFSENLLLEAAGLTWDGAKIKTPPGGNDDEFIAVSIALQVRESSPVFDEPGAGQPTVRSYATI